MSDQLHCQIDPQGRATLRLNRPERHNAFDERLIAALSRTLKRLEADPQVRLIVLTAAGKTFSAGADLHWLRQLTENSRAQNRSAFMALAELLKTLYSLAKPTLALVQGAAYGGGVGLVAACDIVIASERASFCLSEVRLGLIPATISPYLLAAVGARQARRHVLSAEPFSAGEALRIGLIHEVVSEERLTERGNHLTQALLRNGPRALIETKRLVRAVEHRPIDVALLDDSCDRIAGILATAEAREGLQAFREKRPPDWTDQSDV